MLFRLRRIWGRAASFAEQQGFPIIMTVCVAIITASALWTKQDAAEYVSPTPPVNREVSAAQLLQQTLKEAATPTPAPTTAPRKWCPPLEQISVLRAFDAEHMSQNSVTGIWQLHAAVDLAAAHGESIHAISDGTVTANGNDPLLGVWLCIEHGDVDVLYAGMTLTADYIPGDIVEAGAVIGYAGDGPLEEHHYGPHLHLEAMRDGIPIDPLPLWSDT